jgi:hypothetical protein
VRVLDAMGGIAAGAGVRVSKATKRKPNTTVDGELACMFGEPWLGPHPLCRLDLARTLGCPIEDVELVDYSHLAPKQLGKQEDEFCLT